MTVARTDSCPLRDEHEQDLWCDSESGIAFDELYELFLLLASHELQSVVFLRKRPQDVHQRRTGYDWVIVVVRRRLGMAAK